MTGPLAMNAKLATITKAYMFLRGIAVFALLVPAIRGPANCCYPTSQYNLPMPKTVAVIGASRNRAKFGNKALRAFAQQGYVVFPINPHEREIEGHPVYASVLDVPVALDMATVYVHADAGVKVMDELAAKKVGEVWLNPGADDPEVVERARQLGLKTIQACSIIGIGESPRSY